MLKVRKVRQRRKRTDARQHADQGPDQAAQKAEVKILGRQDDAKSGKKSADSTSTTTTNSAAPDTSSSSTTTDKSTTEKTTN